jgi:hypothetical protein
VLRVGSRVAELDLPVHAAAERLVPRMAATAEAVVLERRTLVPLDRGAIAALDHYSAGDPVRPVLRNLDRRFPVLIDLVSYLLAVDCEAERA